MDKICYANCYNRYHDYGFQGAASNKTEIWKTFILQPQHGKDISLTRLPKINLIEFLFSVGGHFTMWFGISLFHLREIYLHFRKIFSTQQNNK
jgi:hypothetical protein